MVRTLLIAALLVANGGLAEIRIDGEGQDKTLLNLGDEPLLAVSCTYDIESPETGELAQVEYVMSFVGPLMTDSPLTHNDEYQLFKGPLMIETGVWADRLNLNVTGAVFRSGRVVGPEGQRLLLYLKDVARETGHQIRDIRKKMEALSHEEAGRMFKTEPTMVKGRNSAMVQYKLRKHLLTRKGLLRSDYLEVLDGLADYLANF